VNKLNGWRRLWVVLSVTSLLYVAWYSLQSGINAGYFEWDVYSEFEKPECKNIIEMPAGTKLNIEPGYKSSCYSLYLYRSIYSDARSTQQEYINHTNSLQRTRSLETFGFTFVLWLLSISFAYLAGKVVGWVFMAFFQQVANKT